MSLLTAVTTSFVALVALVQTPAGNVVRPAILERVAAEYTPEAREAGVEGRVVVETIIRADGTPEVTRPTRGLPMGLTQKAIEAVEQWTFQPGTINGFPAEMRMNIEVFFSLDETADRSGEHPEAPETTP